MSEPQYNKYRFALAHRRACVYAAEAAQMVKPIQSSAHGKRTESIDALISAKKGNSYNLRNFWKVFNQHTGQMN